MTTLLDTFKRELSYEGRRIEEIERVVFRDTLIAMKPRYS